MSEAIDNDEHNIAEFSFAAEFRHVDFGKSFDQMSISEVEKVVEWYYNHVGNRAYNDAFAAAVSPYLERRRQNLPATWRHRYDQGEYARKSKEAYERLVAARDARIAADQKNRAT